MAKQGGYLQVADLTGVPRPAKVGKKVKPKKSSHMMVEKGEIPKPTLDTNTEGFKVVKGNEKKKKLRKDHNVKRPVMLRPEAKKRFHP